jgi:hypothetical protein
MIAPFSKESILQLARHVADIKHGRESSEEKAEAIGKFVTSFVLEGRTVLRNAAMHASLAPVPRILAIKAPIVVRELASRLGLQPHQLIAELMNLNVFANINQTIEPDIASRIAEIHGFVLEVEGRDKGAPCYFAPTVLVEEARLLETPLEDLEKVPSLDEIMQKLHALTVNFLDTADALASALRDYSDLDWSPAVIMLCKAFEKETVERLVMPLRKKSSGRNLRADASHEDLGRIARFCSGGGKPPELGTLCHFLRTAIHSKHRRTTSILVQTFYELVSDWPHSHWLVDKLGLEAALERLTKDFRNRAAHIEKLNESDFSDCRHFVREAPEIVLLKLFVATSR